MSLKTQRASIYAENNLLSVLDYVYIKITAYRPTVQPIAISCPTSQKEERKLLLVHFEVNSPPSKSYNKILTFAEKSWDSQEVR